MPPPTFADYAKNLNWLITELYCLMLSCERPPNQNSIFPVKRKYLVSSEPLVVAGIIILKIIFGTNFKNLRYIKTTTQRVKHLSTKLFFVWCKKAAITHNCLMNNAKKCKRAKKSNAPFFFLKLFEPFLSCKYLQHKANYRVFILTDFVANLNFYTKYGKMRFF